MFPEELKRKQYVDLVKEVVRIKNEEEEQKQVQEQKQIFSKEVEKLVEISLKYGNVSEKIEALERRIDKALEEGNRELFYRLSKKLKEIKGEIEKIS